MDYVEIIRNVDPVTLVFVIFGYFSLKNKFKDCATKEDFKNLQQQVFEIDKRLCRIEGALSAKECCMLKDDAKMKKVQ